MSPIKADFIKPMNSPYPQKIFKARLSPVPVKRPLFASRVPAGFPSPADDHLESALDLNEHLIRHPAATFFVRVQGISMLGAGIHHDDLLIVDRSLEPRNGSIVVAVVNGEFTVKRLVIKDDKIWLCPENPAYESLQLGEGMELQIWGVVAHVIHSLKEC